MKDDETTKYQKRFHELQMTIDQLESQVCRFEEKKMIFAAKNRFELKIGTVAAEQNQQLRSANAAFQQKLEQKEFLLSQIVSDRDDFKEEIQVFFSLID